MAYMWGCSWENGASNWKDSERCTAGSRKPVKTERAAQKQADAHSTRSGHYKTWTRKIHGNTKLRRV